MLLQLASKIVNGIEKFTFGKYSGKSVNHVLQADPEYIKWVKEKTNKNFSFEFEQKINNLKL